MECCSDGVQKAVPPEAAPQGSAWGRPALGLPEPRQPVKRPRPTELTLLQTPTHHGPSTELTLQK